MEREAGRGTRTYSNDSRAREEFDGNALGVKVGARLIRAMSAIFDAGTRVCASTFAPTHWP